MNAGLTVVKIFTVITTVMMRFSLVPDFVRMRKQRSTGDMSVMPPVLLFTNCYTLSFYSYVIGDIVPLFATSVLGVVVGAILTSLFFSWTSYKRDTVKVIITAVLVCLMATIYAVLAVTGVTRQSHASVSTTLGFITIGTTIALYASPMATIIRVLQIKTASSMPFTMGVVNVMNNVGWILYSSLVANMFIFAPNIGGIMLGTTQMVLTYVYSGKARADAQISSSSSEGRDDQTDISVVIQSTGQEDQEKWQEYSSNSSFVASYLSSCCEGHTPSQPLKR